jgi:HSP20 family molecular chaperone IbpA
MHTPTDFLINKSSIRKEFDSSSGTWQYSVADVLGQVSESADPRNYWKVLKNRLKKSYPELVTKCNQLKLLSPDGKNYLTDTADSETMLGIIRHVSPAHVRAYLRWFEEIENRVQKIDVDTRENLSAIAKSEIAELAIDAYLQNNFIFVEAFVGGVSIENISISVTFKILKISGKRIHQNSSQDDYLKNEIYWGEFEREIILPHSVDVDEVEATLHLGVLKIKLPRIDIERIRTIKIKSI